MLAHLPIHEIEVHLIKTPVFPNQDHNTAKYYVCIYTCTYIHKIKKNDIPLTTTSGRKERRTYLHIYIHAFLLSLSLSLSLSLLYKLNYILYL